ncbi:MAG TPA: hypothetical protein VK670_02565 [Silvibacterium sp.]|nr:hypothetical protein [Silvibacterium sp.]
MPVTGSDVFGREEDIAFLDDAWANQDVNVGSIVAWAGVGKSTLVNHWLRRMAAEKYRSAELAFGWSFYRQGTSGGTSSADEFIDATLAWFGDPDPRLGTAWEKGERLAKLIAHRRTLLVLDGLEPLQNPPVGDQFRPVRSPAGVSAWYNAYDTRDVVALYPLDADEFPVQPAITNYGKVRNSTDDSRL